MLQHRACAVSEGFRCLDCSVLRGGSLRRAIRHIEAITHVLYSPMRSSRVFALCKCRTLCVQPVSGSKVVFVQLSVCYFKHGKHYCYTCGWCRLCCCLRDLAARVLDVQPWQMVSGRLSALEWDAAFIEELSVRRCAGYKAEGRSRRSTQPRRSSL